MNIVGQDKYVFVKFYTRWCRYCKEMHHDYEDLITKMAKRNDIIIARLDGSESKDISEMYNIHSYPSLYLFKPGSIGVKGIYMNNRISSLMEQWLDNNAPVIEKPLPSIQQVEVPNNQKLKEEQIANIEDKKQPIDSNELKSLKSSHQDLAFKNEKLNKDIETLHKQLKNMEITVENLNKRVEELNMNFNLFKENNKNDKNQNNSINPEIIIAFFGFAAIIVAIVIVISKMLKPSKKISIEDKVHV